MKFLSSQITYFLSERDTRENIGALLKYLIFLLLVIALYSVLFHVIMLYAEGRYHSWVTGVYWTLTVMTTLGFGDITFTSDIGRLFSIVVLLSGIVLLLIVLPFMFIRLFYAPWLEAQVRIRAPREAPADASGHVIICAYDTIAPGLIERLRLHDVPYFVIEPDPTKAAQMHGDGISVITGDVDSSLTYEKLRVPRARLVFANSTDTVNTNIILTVREVAPEVAIVGTVAEEDSIDILELSGCTHVVPLHQRLGQRLAARVNAGHAQTHRIGNIRNLQIADFAVHNTPLVGRTLGELKLQESTGVNVIAVWQRGRLLPARPEIPLANDSVAVVAGTAEQMLELDLLLVIYATNYHPALVIGGGKVGQATARALKQKEIAVHLVERDESLRGKLGNIADEIFIGDAADREVLMKAGLREAPSVILTTNDDAMNIYLAVYCRRLNPELRIISRITHQKNIEAIYRAGADFAISYASLGIEEVFAQLHSRELLILGEGFELFSVLVPPSLADKTVAESNIARRTELSVIGMQHNGRVLTDPPGSTRLTEGSELFMMGGTRGRQAFVEAFGKRQ
ncbi:MAG: potassium transporter TrkA [Deltaproteobacteria bacterium]|nr:potassium transporter TrkA [Deltaproteobacteria bacterium]